MKFEIVINENISDYIWDLITQNAHEHKRKRTEYTFKLFFITNRIIEVIKNNIEIFVLVF